MDINKKETANSKKQVMNENIRLKNLRERISFKIAHLEQLDYSYKIHYNYENLNWIDSNIGIRKRDGYHGIHDDFQIDVDDTETVNVKKIKDSEINSEKFSEQFLSIIPKKSSLIVCHLGGDPEIEISVKAFLSNPTKFFSNPETWIITSDKNWVIEYIWDQSVIRFIQLNNSKSILRGKIIIEE